MPGRCVVCSVESSKYKCSTCLSYYCSASCWKDHKNSIACIKPVTKAVENMEKERCHITEDTVPPGKLLQLGDNKELREYLKNPSLQSILKAVDHSDNPSEFIQKAMQDELFVKFVDICLGMVEESEEPA